MAYESRAISGAATTLIQGGKGMLGGFVIAAGVSAVTLTLRDYVSGVPSGTAKVWGAAPAGNQSDVQFAEPVPFGKGIVATVTGVGAKVTILFK